MEMSENQSRETYRLVITFSNGVSEDCIMGIIGDWYSKYIIKSRTSTKKLKKLIIGLHLKTVYPDVVRYLSCLDGIKRVLLVAVDRQDIA